MELRDYIELAEEILKTGRAVAKHVGVTPTALSDAKKNGRGLPSLACVKLAQLIEADPLAVIAASELTTEKDEEKRAAWLPFVTSKGWRRGWDSNPR